MSKTAVRNYVNQDLKINSWDDLKEYFDELGRRSIESVNDLQQWFKDRSELESIISEDMGWRYIRMTCFTDKEEYSTSYREFVEKIQPHISPQSDRLNRKAIDSPYLSQLEKMEGYDIMIREMKKEVEIFREENIPLFTELQTMAQEYSSIMGAMAIEHNGQELTLQQAAVLLQENDRVLREDIWKKIGNERLESADKLHDLFSNMVLKRQQLAENAGFENFRDYKFKAMGRFDYTPEDCFQFHEAVEEEVTPLLKVIAEHRKEQLHVDALRPWDKSVDISGKPALKPFTTSEELLQRTINCFKRLDPYFSECLITMNELGHLDLESRKGKAPGGYNYPLAETGAPFIFMNATSTLRDMVTLLHEGGHAVHSFLTHELELTDFKHTPSEVAELASMSMELITMDFWDEFFKDKDELKRAKMEHLEGIIETLPWVATIDKFQHWIYENPTATVEERTREWVNILQKMGDGTTDWTGLEEFRASVWHRQLHLFEVPFYYIEYGMAQLGAVAVWKNYKENPVKGLEGYKSALKLGYKRTIPEVYEAAHISFDFSRENIKELMEFVRTEMEKIKEG